MDVEYIYQNLGRRIRSMRNANNSTQDQIAKRAGMSRASLANIEGGRQQVLVHHLFSLAEALDLEKPSELLLFPDYDGQTQGSVNALPISKEGLTEKQQREVLILMGDGTSKEKRNEEL